MTPAGYARLKAELLHLLDVERPRGGERRVVGAKNGDRSENGDYLYGKRRLREIDRRTRFLSKALENAVVVDPAAKLMDQVFFGATVTYWREAAQAEETISIVGRDEIDTQKGYVSWMSPIAKALLKKHVGDSSIAYPSGCGCDRNH